MSNFFSGISGDGICSKEATKILEEEGSALCEKFLSCPLSMVDKGEARTVTICTQTDRRASLSHWFDRSSIESRGFFVWRRTREREREREERFGSRVVTEEIRRRRWGEVHPGRCISVITERDPIRGGRPPLFPSCNTFLTRVYALPPSFLCILFFLLPIQRYSLWSKLRFRDKREFWYDIS